MTPAIDAVSVGKLQDYNSSIENIVTSPADAERISGPVIACVILNSSDSELMITMLQKLSTQTTAAGHVGAAVLQRNPQPSESQDSWLDHNAAAAYLGIAKSTLYRYAEQERIETCKMGGRLEYRRSSLDKFKDQHVRPARRYPRGRGIIPSALSSGK
jgi:excisionase family DNA binding protein